MKCRPKFWNLDSILKEKVSLRVTKSSKFSLSIFRIRLGHTRHLSNLSPAGSTNMVSKSVLDWIIISVIFIIFVFFQEFYKYWPDVDNHFVHKDTTVLTTSEVANGNIITRKIRVTTNKVKHKTWSIS